MRAVSPCRTDSSTGVRSTVATWSHERELRAVGSPSSPITAGLRSQGTALPGRVRRPAQAVGWHIRERVDAAHTVRKSTDKLLVSLLRQARSAVDGDDRGAFRALST